LSKTHTAIYKKTASNRLVDLKIIDRNAPENKKILETTTAYIVYVVGPQTSPPEGRGHPLRTP